MMGMNDSAFWLSWYFFYFGVFTILSIIFSALLKVNIYSRTNYGFIFLYFWIFSFSLISFGLLVSVLLKSPRSAILLAIVAFLAGYVLYQIFGGDDRPASTTTALCLFSPSCFGVIVRIVGALEQAQTGVTFSSASRVVYNMSYNRAILLMLLDGLLYLFFTWYFDKVLPSEFGVRKKWYFLFQKEFWLSGRRRNIDDKGNYFELKSNPQMGDFFENVSNSENRRGIVIRGLSKRFPPSSGSDPVVAVDNLMMDMFEGEVFALLVS